MCTFISVLKQIACQCPRSVMGQNPDGLSTTLPLPLARALICPAISTICYPHEGRPVQYFLHYSRFNPVNISVVKRAWNNLYSEPVYTGWYSVHCNATGLPLVDPVCTGIPLGDPANTCRVHRNTTGKLTWNSPTQECHWRNLVETAPHWDATGENFAAYTGKPLEEL